MFSSRAFLAALAFAAIATAALVVDAPRGQAESPIQFLSKQHARRQASPQPVYPRQPVPVFGQGLFGLFEFEVRRPPPVRTAAPRNFERVVCERQCDGARLALGISPKRGSNREAEAMCAAAGQGSPTRLIVEKFVPGGGFTPAVAAAEPRLIEGRAALDTSTASATASASACPQTAEKEPFMVPLLHDATLRSGDIVATRDGFKVFVGRGRPPFRSSDFVDADTKRIAADVRKLQIATR
jgi:hypothetical protein